MSFFGRPLHLQDSVGGGTGLCTVAWTGGTTHGYCTFALSSGRVRVRCCMWGLGSAHARPMPGGFAQCTAHMDSHPRAVWPRYVAFVRQVGYLSSCGASLLLSGGAELKIRLECNAGFGVLTHHTRHDTRDNARCGQLGSRSASGTSPRTNRVAGSLKEPWTRVFRPLERPRTAVDTAVSPRGASFFF